MEPASQIHTSSNIGTESGGMANVSGRKARLADMRSSTRQKVTGREGMCLFASAASDES